MVVAVNPKIAPKPSFRPANPIAQRIGWQEFQRKYLSREDLFKYEWVDGMVEKTPRDIDKNQVYILQNLLDFLSKLKQTKNIDGNLISEVDTFFLGNHRRPDICFLTKTQIRAGKNDGDVVPKFVIEIISKNDQANKIGKKMADYWAAGVEVIWHIYPQLQRIDVFHGKKMTACMDDDLCSAEPVIEGFLISVNDVLK